MPSERTEDIMTLELEEVLDLFKQLRIKAELFTFEELKQIKAHYQALKDALENHTLDSALLRQVFGNVVDNSSFEDENYDYELLQETILKTGLPTPLNNWRPEQYLQILLDIRASIPADKPLRNSNIYSLYQKMRDLAE